MILLELMSEKNVIPREAHREKAESDWHFQAQVMPSLVWIGYTGHTQGMHINVLDSWARGVRGLGVEKYQLLPKLNWWQENPFKDQKVRL